MNFDDFILDDEEFAKTAGISTVSKTWKAAFDFIANKAKELSSLSESGAVNTKDFNLRCQRLIHATTKINEILSLQSKMCKNTLGTVFEEDNDDTSYVPVSDSELIEKLQSIIDNYTTINLSEAKNQIEINNKNIENDGDDHGDINDIEW